MHNVFYIVKNWNAQYKKNIKRIIMLVQSDTRYFERNILLQINRIYVYN